jgi:HipA-like C-terminal domain
MDIKISKKLRRIKPENFSEYSRMQVGKIPTLKSHHYTIQSGYIIIGDAPKQFIPLYEFGTSKKVAKRTWSLYIAKTAQKWYPNESVLEYLLNRIGVIWGLDMAYSRLVWGNGQVRFLSRYFLKEDEELVHCADILAGYFNDRQFIQEIENQDREREFNTVQLFEDVLRKTFPDQCENLFASYIKMLLFDALVGNNDRHFYNYGIIKHLENDYPPRYSPIYDTARGLLWNEKEEKVVSLWQQPIEAARFIEKYVKNSRPKIGWEGQSNINHFDLVKLLAKNELGMSYENIKAFYSVDKLNASLRMIDNEFSGILSPERLVLTKQCLRIRFDKLNELLP